jgi:TolB-like protein/Tfp pilus assembly protein PilF
MGDDDKQKFAVKNAVAATKSLAIIPFRFLHGKTEAPLGFGLADALSIKLHNIAGIKLRPTSVVLKHLDKMSDPFLLGKSLGVDYILDGHILPTSEQLRVSAQLLDIKNQNVVWAAQFDEAQADIFQLEDAISARVVELLVPQLTDKSDAETFSEIIIDEASRETTDESLALQADEFSAPVEESETLILPEQRKAFRLPLGGIWLIPAAIILIAISALFAFWLFGARGKQTAKTVAPQTLAVLPFRSEGDAANSLGIGFADTLSNKLGAVHRLSVRAASSSRTLANLNRDAVAVGRELDAEFVVRGAMQKTTNGDLQINADLVNAKTAAVVFSENFAVPNSDLHQSQTRIAARILNALQISPTPEERAQLDKHSTENGLAYELYLVGRYQLTDRTADGARRAIQFFNQAAARDPNFALAYVGLADAYRLQYFYQFPPPPDAMEKSKENAVRALALDAALAEAHATLAETKFYEHNRREAEQAYLRAIELNPSYAPAHHWYGLALIAMNRHEDALREIKTAQKLDPQSLIIQTAVGMVYFYARRFPEAVAECQKVLEKNAGFVPAHRVSRFIYQAQKNYPAALDAYRKQRSFFGSTDENDPAWMMTRAQVEAVGGNRAEALALLERSLAAPHVSDNPQGFSYEIAIAFAEAGEKEKALEWLEKAFAARDRNIVYLAVEPALVDNLRDDARFAALVNKLQSPN